MLIIRNAVSSGVVKIGVLTKYDSVPPEAEANARALGKAIARRGHILISGGDDGLIRAVSEAAFREGARLWGLWS